MRKKEEKPWLWMVSQDLDDASMEIADAKLPYGYATRTRPRQIHESDGSYNILPYNS